MKQYGGVSSRLTSMCISAHHCSLFFNDRLSTDILTCQTVTNNINDGCIPFRCHSTRALVSCLQPRLHGAGPSVRYDKIQLYLSRGKLFVQQLEYKVGNSANMKYKISVRLKSKIYLAILVLLLL